MKPVKAPCSPAGSDFYDHRIRVFTIQKQGLQPEETCSGTLSLMERTHAFDDVPDYVHELIKELMEVSGKEFVVGIHDDFQDDYIYQWPSPDRPFHLLKLNASMKKHLNHIITLNAVKLTRIYEIPPQERVVPKAMLDGRLPPHYELQLSALYDFRTDELKSQSSRLYYAMTSQLTNIPIDLRCEHIVHDRYPEHRAEQRRFLEREISKLESLVKPDEVEIEVPHIHLASTAINTAYILEASDIADLSPPGDTLTGPYHDIASDLLQPLHAEAVESYRGDCRIVDIWARELGFEGWYAWQSIPQE